MRAWFLPVVVVLAFGVPAFAEVVGIDASVRERALWSDLELLEDAGASLTLSDVTQPEVASRFHRYPGRFAPNFGIPASAIWVRLGLRNTTDATMERWLEVDQSTLDEIRLFEPEGTTRVQGRRQPLAAQEVRRPTYAFRLVLPPGEVRTYHLRFVSENELQLPLVLWEAGALSEHDIRRSLALALVYGVMLAMALYNLFLFAFTRDVAHLFYSVYVTGFGLWLSLLDGTLPMLLPRSIGVLPRWPFIATSTLAFVANALFARRLLQLERSRPRLDRTVLVLGALVTVWSVLGTVLLPWRTQNNVAPVLLLVMLFVLLVSGVLRWRDGFAPARYYLAAFVGLFAFIVLGALATQGLLPFGGPGLFLHAGAVTEAVLLSLALAEGTRRRNLQIERLHEAGRRFVPFEFLALLKRPELPDVRVGDQVEREMTVFFADIRGFTRLVEGLSPAATIELVNAYLQAMEPPIRAQGGFIDKYIGDAVMALFETPAAAARAALGCLAAIEKLNESRPEALRIRIGIGLHTGPLVLGTVGSPERLSCTVVGDSVNLASRVESLTKRYEVPVLLTERTRAGLPASLALRALDRVAVKGKSAPVELFELLDALPAPARTRRSALAESFQAARGLLTKGSVAEAAATFEAIVSEDPADAAARLHLERAREWARSGLPVGWDGVTRLDAK